MTYCVGVLTQSGLIAMADTRITSGTETTTANKLYLDQREGRALFIMTSGLRSVRDKALTYFREVVEDNPDDSNKLYKAVNKFAAMIKKVAAEDKASLEASGLDYNLHSIVGGQLRDDPEPKLYMLYPQGNWIEIGPATPYVIIGNSGFGTPMLRRGLQFDSSLEYALRCAFLSFDATRISANDVDFPLDVAVLTKGSFRFTHTRFEADELLDISSYWNEKLRKAVSNMPVEVLDRALDGQLRTV